MFARLTSRKSFLVSVSVGILVLVLTAVYVTASFLYSRTLSLVIEQLHYSMSVTAKLEAQHFLYTDLDALQVEEDYQRPEAHRLSRALQAIKHADPTIAFAYIVRLDPEKKDVVVNVADADSENPLANTDTNPSNDVDLNGDGIIDPNGADQLTPPGYVYTDAPLSDVRRGYNGIAITDFYTDIWGTEFTVYAPIYRSDTSVAGLLALDVRDTSVEMIKSQVLAPFILFIGTLALIVALLSVVLILLWLGRYSLIQSLDEQKEIAIGMIGHELQSPIASIRWLLSEALEKIKRHESSSSIEPLLEQAHTVTKNAADLSSVILDLSRIQFGKLQLKYEQVSVTEILKDILEELEGSARSQGVSIVEHGEGPHTINADKQYLAVALKNSISNALKYSPRNSIVDIGIENRDAHVLITIADRGPGIPEEELSKVFSGFYRTSSAKNVIGTGLGLYISKHIIELHGGSYTLEKRSGGGTLCKIVLPLS